jgi:hypothetical protein
MSFEQGFLIAPDKAAAAASSLPGFLISAVSAYNKKRFQRLQ